MSLCRPGRAVEQGGDSAVSRRLGSVIQLNIRQNKTLTFQVFVQQLVVCVRSP